MIVELGGVREAGARWEAGVDPGASAVLVRTVAEETEAGLVARGRPVALADQTHQPASAAGPCRSAHSGSRCPSGCRYRTGIASLVPPRAERHAHGLIMAGSPARGQWPPRWECLLGELDPPAIDPLATCVIMQDDLGDAEFAKALPALAQPVLRSPEILEAMGGTGLLARAIDIGPAEHPPPPSRDTVW